MLPFLFFLLFVFPSNCVTLLLSNKSTAYVLPITFSALLKAGASSPKIAPGDSIFVENVTGLDALGYVEIRKGESLSMLRTRGWNLTIDPVKERLRDALLLEIQWVDSTAEIKNSVDLHIIEEPWIIFRPGTYDTVHLKIRRIN